MQNSLKLPLTRKAGPERPIFPDHVRLWSARASLLSQPPLI